jgi:hypothetical protein
MRFQSASTGRSKAFRRSVFNFETTISIGFKSGEERGRKCHAAPVASIAFLIFGLLCALRLSLKTMSPSASVGTSTFSPLALKHLKHSPLIAPSRTKGAVRPSRRSHERRRRPVSIRHVGIKPLAAAASSMGGRHVGLDPSSMKTRRGGSSSLWPSCRRARAAAMSGRSCSVARTIFFKGDLLLGEKAPNRAVANMDMTRRKLAPYVMQRQIGLLRCGRAANLARP